MKKYGLLILCFILLTGGPLLAQSRSSDTIIVKNENYKQAEKDLKKAEKEQKAYQKEIKRLDKATDRLRKYIVKFESDERKGKLSPIDIRKREKKIKQQEKKIEKIQKRINKMDNRKRKNRN
jgi:peptidoglycan hydrolase CwlO-like protein